MDYDRPMISYTVAGIVCVHDDFGNLIPINWASAFQLMMFLLSDNEQHLY